MNRKFTLYLAALVLILATVYITTVFGLHSDKPPVVTTASIDASPPAAADSTTARPADESIAELPAEASAITEPAQQEVPAGVKEPSRKAAPTAPNNPESQKPQQTKPAANSGSVVSRAVVPADTAKYPLVSKVNGSYGQFHYRNLSGGRIEVDPQWIKANIVTITLPGLNRSVQVNQKAADNFVKAFTLIKNGTAVVNGRTVPLLSLVKTMDGTWVTRHVNWDPSRGLSNHSWGTAIDINAANHFRYVDTGTEPNDPNLILWEKAFRPAGFSWGNSYGDSMHYELLD
ncbi:MAG: M15 family metallopeptidase [Syntrophomonadaceae bacterium]